MNVFVFNDKLRTVVVAALELSNSPVPVTFDQRPTPSAGVLAERVKELTHVSSFAPANAIVGVLFTIVTISEAEQLFAETVQRSVFVPGPKSVTVAFSSLIGAIFPEPIATIHAPLPPPTVPALNWIVLVQIVSSLPASMVNELLEIVTSSASSQPPLLTVQRKVFPPWLKPETRVVNVEGESITPAPLTLLHCPVPMFGSKAEIV